MLMYVRGFRSYAPRWEDEISFVSGEQSMTAVCLGTNVLISKWEPYERVSVAECIFNWWASGIPIIFPSKADKSNKLSLYVILIITVYITE